jgi:hypothetical protein
MASGAEGILRVASSSRVPLREIPHARLLAELEASPYRHSAENVVIARLRDKFNAIIDEKAELTTSALLDPTMLFHGTYGPTSLSTSWAMMIEPLYSLTLPWFHNPGSLLSLPFQHFSHIFDWITGKKITLPRPLL